MKIALWMMLCLLGGGVYGQPPGSAVSPLARELEDCRAENERLRRENQTLRDQLSGVSSRAVDDRVAEKMRQAGVWRNRIENALYRLSEFYATRIYLYGNEFQVFVVNTKAPSLSLDCFWRFPYGNRAVISNFEGLNRLAKAGNRQLLFAMNAGMYQPDGVPKGLLISNGVTQHPFIDVSGVKNRSGNFFLPPNGVFCIGASGIPYILESQVYPAFRRQHPYLVAATQSGPMLVRKGEINGAFNPGSNNRFIRNGVGVRDGQYVLFAISKYPVTFHDFALLFKSALGCSDALFLDGTISRVYCPALQLNDRSGRLGPMIGLFK